MGLVASDSDWIGHREMVRYIERKLNTVDRIDLEYERGAEDRDSTECVIAGACCQLSGQQAAPSVGSASLAAIA
jgi:hypothetical protein